MEGNETRGGETPTLQESESPLRPRGGLFPGDVVANKAMQHGFRDLLIWRGREIILKDFQDARDGILEETEPHRQEWERSPSGSGGWIEIEG